MIALTYPFIVLVLFGVFVFSIYKRRYIVSVCLVIGCLFLNYYAKAFALNFLDSTDRINSGFEVLTFNINGSEITDDIEIERLFELIIHQDADVLFLAEDFEPIGEKLNKLLKSHYPFTSYEQKFDCGGHYFYSKFPLGKVDHIDIKSNRFSFCFHCKMAYRHGSISVFGCHLASNNYKLQAPSIRPEDIDGISSLGEYLNNIESATKQRMEEVVGITRHPDFNKMSIVLGDFNDVSGSKPLRALENAGLKDAWWEKGLGYGATVSHPLPFRIDHILYGEGLKLKNIKIIDSEGLSDHDALVATFEY